jgi:hypothetical protein
MGCGLFRPVALSALVVLSACRTLKPSVVGTVDETRAGSWRIASGRERGVCAGGTFRARDDKGVEGNIRLKSCAGWVNLEDGGTNAVLGTWLEGPCGAPTLVHTELWAIELVGEDGQVLGVSSAEPNAGPGVCLSGVVNNQVLVPLRDWQQWKPGRYTVRYSFVPRDALLGQSTIEITP